MHVFVTGATGWVGSAIVEDLVAAGHRVTGLSRTESKAITLAAAGATVRLGTLDDLEILHDAAHAADAVIHTAFSHDFSNIAASAAQDIRAIEALGAALQGADRPLLVTSGVAVLDPGRIGLEIDVPPSN
ncbi:MAG: NAD(P)H-binding protein, partial [Solirubrobacteraceae bacterium]|nr:NAD(P)H-binding protein [Solirubrobacteraceae bacterium]